jgi:hypothetical protein
MARFKGFVFREEPDPRREGSMQFADPSTARMTRDIHTFNEPHSRRAVGENNGINTPFGHQAPWSQTADAHRMWESMNRKREVKDDG